MKVIRRRNEVATRTIPGSLAEEGSCGGGLPLGRHVDVEDDDIAGANLDLFLLSHVLRSGDQDLIATSFDLGREFSFDVGLDLLIEDGDEDLDRKSVV